MIDRYLVRLFRGLIVHCKHISSRCFGELYHGCEKYLFVSSEFLVGHFSDQHEHPDFSLHEFKQNNTLGLTTACLYWSFLYHYKTYRRHWRQYSTSSTSLCFIKNSIVGINKRRIRFRWCSCSTVSATTSLWTGDISESREDINAPHAALSEFRIQDKANTHILPIGLEPLKSVNKVSTE